jgi:iron complex transport system ATP-binding protein
VIQATSISKRYDDLCVLEDVSVNMPKGEVITLIGANGAGKSTLLSIVSRLKKGDGQVQIDGKAMDSYTSTELAKKMAILRQTIHINVRLTVRELVAFGRYPHSKSKLVETDQVIIENAIHYMALENLADKFIDELSGGERQRAYIAMVIAQDTDYILLDEPLNNLDMKHSVQIMKLLRKLVDEHNKTVIMVIHDINFASCYSDRIFALKNGRLLYEGSPEEIIRPEVLSQVYDMEFDVQEVNLNRICVYYT